VVLIQSKHDLRRREGMELARVSLQFRHSIKCWGAYWVSLGSTTLESGFLPGLYCISEECVYTICECCEAYMTAFKWQNVMSCNLLNRYIPELGWFRFLRNRCYQHIICYLEEKTWYCYIVPYSLNCGDGFRKVGYIFQSYLSDA